MALTKVTYEMMDTPLPYSVIEGAPISVLDYADLAVVTACRDPGDPNSHLLTSFLNWTPAIQAALDACFDNGGGSVVLPKNTVPYYVQDQIVVKSNTTLICQDWLVLADYNLEGGTLLADGDNIFVQNIQIDNSGIYAGGSGYNGIGVTGSNITFLNGYIKNCARGDVAPADGGKGCQIEPGDALDVVIDGLTFDTCFMAMSTIRDYGTVAPYYGIVYSNITAYNCEILFFVQQSNGAQSPTGLEHSVQLNNFYAVDCGTFEGVIQLSRASNVRISNGIVVVDPGLTPTALIRGNHANCSFTKIGWYGDTAACIQLDPSTYAVDDSQANENNVYEIDIWGTVDFIADANIATSFRTLNNCTGAFTMQDAPSTAFFGFELRNGASMFSVANGTKQGIVSTATSFDGSTLANNFSDLTADRINIPVFQNWYTGFTTIAATSAPNNSLFLDTATGKLSFKNNSGVVNVLY